MSLYFKGYSPPQYRYYRLYVTAIGGADQKYTSIAQLQFYWGGAWRTNAMSANGTGNIGGITSVVSAHSEYTPESLYAYKAFDNNTKSVTTPATFWASDDPNTAEQPRWLKVDFGATNRIAVTAYRVAGRNSASQYPKSWYMQGSHDNSTWYSVGPVKTNQNTMGAMVTVTW